MRERFNILLTDQFIRISLLLSFVFIIPLFILIIVTFRNLPPQIPLFNSLSWGEDRLYTSKVTIFLPFILLLIFLLNLLAASLVYKKYALISRIVFFNGFLFLLLSLLSYLQILFLTY